MDGWQNLRTRYLNKESPDWDHVYPPDDDFFDNYAKFPEPNVNGMWWRVVASCGACAWSGCGVVRGGAMEGDEGGVQGGAEWGRVGQSGALWCRVGQGSTG